MQDRQQQIAIVNRMIEAGESEENIAKVIQKFRELTPAPSPLEELKSKIEPYWKERQQTAHDALPMLGAMTATAVTGGGALPLMLAAGAGGAAGQALKDAPNAEISMGDRFRNMALSGLGQAVTQGVGAAIPAVGGKLVSGARSLWQRAAKITEPVAKQTQTMRMGGSLQAGKDEIAETVLSQGVGTLRQGNTDTLRARMNEIDDAIDRIVSNSQGLVSRDEIRQALQAQRASIQPGTQVAELERNALAASLKLLNRMPSRMTVKTAQKYKRDIYQKYEGSYPADASESARAMADKTTARALRAGVAREEPEVRPLDEAMSRMIPAAKAMDKAVSRGSNQSLVGLSQMMAGMVPNKATVVSALINHPKVSSFTAQQLYNAAQKLPKDARTAANIIRMAETLGLAGGRD